MKKLLPALALLSTSVLAENDIKLAALTDISQPTLVTVGIPVSEFKLNDIDNFSMYDETGNEVIVFVKETLSWKFKSPDRTDIRALKVQFYINSLNSENDEFKFSFDKKRQLKRIEEKPISEGLMPSLDKGEEGLMHPKVIGVLAPDYLSNSGIVPPFYKDNHDMQSLYWDEQFKWSSSLDLNQSQLSNWLFDRVTSLYKGCMRNGSVDCYKEAYVSNEYWMQNIKKDGDLNSCKGGSLIKYNGISSKPCDTKYLYIEPLKIHMALSGDDEKFDAELIRAMADLSEYNHSYQSNESDPYDSVDEAFTERSAGLSLIAQVNAYELTYDEKYKDRVENRVRILREHQLYNPDGLNSSGLWRHSYRKHEGNYIDGSSGSIGYDSPNDRMFSPWMTENIIDGLWQAYNVIGHKDIPEMIRFAGEGLVKWGFYDSKGYLEKHSSPLLIDGKSGTNGCNVNNETVLYIGSSVIDPVYLQNKMTWYTDSHNPEIMTILSLAYHFEKDELKKSEIVKRLNSIGNGYINENCGKDGSTMRKFNWNNRSNYWGTYLWVLNSEGKLHNSAGRPPQINDQFSEDYLLETNWEGSNNIWYVNNDQLETDSVSVLFANRLPESSNYTVGTDLIKNSSSAQFLRLIFAGDKEGNFYSLSIKSGRWGGIYIYKHIASWDYGGKPIFTKLMEIPIVEKHNFVVNVKNNIVEVIFDDDIKFTYIGEGFLINSNIGYMNISNGLSIRADNFKLKNNPK